MQSCADIVEFGDLSTNGAALTTALTAVAALCTYEQAREHHAALLALVQQLIPRLFSDSKVRQ